MNNFIGQEVNHGAGHIQICKAKNKSIRLFSQKLISEDFSFREDVGGTRLKSDDNNINKILTFQKNKSKMSDSRRFTNKLFSTFLFWIRKKNIALGKNFIDLHQSKYVTDVYLLPGV